MWLKIIDISRTISTYHQIYDVILSRPSHVQNPYSSLTVSQWGAGGQSGACFAWACLWVGGSVYCLGMLGVEPDLSSLLYCVCISCGLVQDGGAAKIDVVPQQTSAAVPGTQGCIQKFPDWVDNEINNNNKYLFSSNTKGYGGKTH
jgi:hypothetical protein